MKSIYTFATFLIGFVLTVFGAAAAVTCAIAFVVSAAAVIVVVVALAPVLLVGLAGLVFIGVSIDEQVSN